MEKINAVLSGIVVPLLLTATGIFYCFKLSFFHIFKPSAVLRGLRSDKTAGGVSSAKAVSLALAGTLGVGNIVGVSSAIHHGGFGAVFWMWISALIAMLLKYAEIVLAMRYRGSEGGSAMIYIKAFFSSRGLGRVGAVVSGIFALAFLLNSLTVGSMLQANAIAEAADGVFNISPLIIGAVLCVFTLIMLRKGSRVMASITEILVPLMSFGYIALSLAVMARDVRGVGTAVELIFANAFTPSSAIGGIGGYVFTSSVRYGVMRGLMSNEAGCGTAPAAHALADCKIPAKQGMWGIFEVFVDTVVLCTMTAICVIMNYGDAERFGGSYMMMTISAYAASLGKLASVFISTAVLCFGLATIVCWAHYGSVCAKYLADRRWVENAFIAVYCSCVAIGCFISSTQLWGLADLAMGLMTVINLFVLIGMWKEVKEETDVWIKK